MPVGPPVALNGVQEAVSSTLATRTRKKAGKTAKKPRS